MQQICQIAAAAPEGGTKADLDPHAATEASGAAYRAIQEVRVYAWHW